jgi:hypothetical protein
MTKNATYTGILFALTALLISVPTMSQTSQNLETETETENETAAQSSTTPPPGDSAPVATEPPQSEKLSIKNETAAQSSITPPPQGDPASVTTEPPQNKKLPLQLSTQDGNFVVRPNLLLQPVIKVPLDNETDLSARGSGAYLKRACIGARGTLFKISAYRLWFNLGKGSAKLNDAYADLDPLDGRLVIRAGWFKPKFGRQRLISSSKLQFVEPAQAWSDEQLALNPKRDMGLSLFGMLVGFVEWGVGIFNGEQSYTLEDNRDFSAALRLVLHPLFAAGVGDILLALDETTLKASPRPALAVGGSLMVTRRRDRTFLMEEDADPLTYGDTQLKAGAEVGFRWSIVNAVGEFFWMKTVLDSDLDTALSNAVKSQARTADSHGSGMGAYFQAGVMALPDIVELVVRVDWVDEQMDSDGSRFFPAGGANLYLRGHHLKLQAFYRMNIATGYDKSSPNRRDTPSHLIEVMFQAGF